MEEFKNAKTVQNRRLTESELDQKELAFELEEAKSRIAAEIIGISLSQYLVLIGESADETAALSSDGRAAEAVMLGYVDGNVDPKVKANLDEVRLIDPSFNAYILNMSANRYADGVLGKEGKKRLETEMQNNPDLQLLVQECCEIKDMHAEWMIETILLKVKERKNRVLYN